MLKEQNRIPKLILTPNQIDSNSSFQVADNEQLTMCDECKGTLFYIEKVWGVVCEDLIYGIINYKEKRMFSFREIGLNVYCAECGEFNESYSKWFYPEDRLIMTFNDFENTEQIEIQHCLNQFNQKHDFKTNYKNFELDILKEKLNSYIKKHKIK
ncbi:MAG: hypothetical protein ACFFG0_03260 [Candidatus Thorarchaeota archaeon]